MVRTPSSQLQKAQVQSLVGELQSTSRAAGQNNNNNNNTLNKIKNYHCTWP